MKKTTQKVSRHPKAHSTNDAVQMDALIIKALMESLSSIFTTMMDANVELGAPVAKLGKTAKGGVSALIGMNAQSTNGSIAVTLPMPALAEISRKLLGQEITEISRDAAELAGELSNMLAGSAKRILSEQGHDFDMQTPQMLMGERHDIDHHHAGETVLLPVTVGKSEFFIELNFV